MVAKQIAIYYSSVGGNTKLVVDTAIERLIGEIMVQKARMGVALNTGVDLVILACPTYDHGQLETNFHDFLETNNAVNLSKTSVAVIGLGDKKYDAEHIMESATLLEKWVLAHNGTLIIAPLKIHATPLDQLTQVRDWANTLQSTIS